VACGIAACDVEGGPRDIGREHPRAGKLARQRDGEAAAAGADVHDHDRRAARERFECGLDDELGFGSRRQHVARHFEIEAPKLTGADDLRDRLSLQSSCDELGVSLLELGGR
jgi:hypothetical protein